MHQIGNHLTPQYCGSSSTTIAPSKHSGLSSLSAKEPNNSETIRSAWCSRADRTNPVGSSNKKLHQFEEHGFMHRRDHKMMILMMMMMMMIMMIMMMMMTTTTTRMMMMMMMKLLFFISVSLQLGGCLKNLSLQCAYMYRLSSK